MKAKVERETKVVGGKRKRPTPFIAAEPIDEVESSSQLSIEPTKIPVTSGRQLRSATKSSKGRN